MNHCVHEILNGEDLDLEDDTWPDSLEPFAAGLPEDRSENNPTYVKRMAKIRNLHREKRMHQIVKIVFGEENVSTFFSLEARLLEQS